MTSVAGTKLQKQLVIKFKLTKDIKVYAGPVGQAVLHYRLWRKN